MSATNTLPSPTIAEIKRPKSKRRSTVLILAALIVIAGFVAAYWVGSTSFSYSVKGSGMRPTLKDGDALLFKKDAYNPKRGDIVLFDTPLGDGPLVKRVIAVAGDNVEIRADSNPPGEKTSDCGYCGVYVNGVKLDEPYAADLPDYDMPETIVPTGYIFLLGDNRRNSEDSHIFGPLDIKYVKGVAIFSLKPFGFIGNKSK